MTHYSPRELRAAKEQLTSFAVKARYAIKQNDVRPISVRFSAKFSDYNANVRYTSSEIIFSVSPTWIGVSEEIVTGLFQHLFSKAYKLRIRTMETDLYHSFTQKLSDYIHVTSVDHELKASFDRMNERFFSGMMEVPNLKWGSASTTKLGDFNFHTNTITISTIFQGAPDLLLLDFVMYHEMLHKKHKFKATGNSHTYHSSAFRRDEALYGVPDIEERLQKYCRTYQFAKKKSSLHSFLRKWAP
ncbi:MAG: M48 family metallopeptidase [Candidatus Woesearchaeota archaeon]|nr:MAG: M48 family metallopeptidase [Candidatus Woesearchaeota archaeon]